MRKLELLLGFGCCVLGLLALRMVLAARPAAAVTTSPVVNEIRTACRLPAGTVVFVVRDSEQP